MKGGAEERDQIKIVISHKIYKSVHGLVWGVSITGQEKGGRAKEAKEEEAR